MKKILIVEENFLVRLGIKHLIEHVLLSKLLVEQAWDWTCAQHYLLTDSAITMCLLNACTQSVESSDLLRSVQNLKPQLSLLLLDTRAPAPMVISRVKEFMANQCTEPEQTLGLLAKPKAMDRLELIHQLLCQGMSNKHIAAQCALSEGTVKNYVSEIFRQLRVSSRLQAAQTPWNMHPKKK